MENNTNSHGFFKNFIKYLPLLQNLTSKDIKIKYRRSILGIAWSVLNPLLTMLVLTAVFGILLGMGAREGVGGDFAVYYIVGASIWNFFSEATTGCLTSVITSASLIKKVYIPKYIFPLEKCLFALVNFMFSLIAVAIVMLIRMDHINPGATILMFPIPVFYCALFAIGVGLILSAVSVYFQDVIHLYSVFLTLWMYLTPLIYPISMIENAGSGTLQQLALCVIKYNPMTMFMNYFRDVMINNQIPGLAENLICFGYGIVFLALGAFVFNKLQKKFILHI